MCLKCPSNDRGNASYDLLKETINKNATPTQARGDKGSEDKLIAKNMVMLHNTHHEGFISDKHMHNKRIECLGGSSR